MKERHRHASLETNIGNRQRNLIAERIAMGEALASSARQRNGRALNREPMRFTKPAVSKRINKKVSATASSLQAHSVESGYLPEDSASDFMVRNEQHPTSSKPARYRDLLNARAAKQDEFYTQLSDISDELRHYKAQLRGKTILCNCDDPYESNFFKYFALNFNALALKKLIATSYVRSPIVGRQLPLLEIEGLKPEGKEPYAVEIKNVPDHKRRGTTDITDVEYLLKHDANTAWTMGPDATYNGGDFRSHECVKLLRKADIVITNPPFSLFREYVGQLIEHNKQFIIIGNINAASTKDIFKLIKENRLWLGESIHSGDREFRVPEHYPLEAAGFRVDENGVKYIRVKGVRWFTNLDVPQRHEEIPLYKRYSPAEYPTYDNYDAIEVSKTVEIPADYYGPMGVPITFLDKYNPDQFEILGITDRDNNSGLKTKEYTEEDVPNPGDLNRRAVIKEGLKHKPTYARLLIRRKTT